MARAGRQATGITRDTIVAAAIELLNEEGLDGVSLRQLAARLGVKAPSLYWHFRDKSALLAAVMEKTFTASLDAVPRHRNWQDWMRAFGMSLWRTQSSVRDFGRLITTTELDATLVARATQRIRERVRALNLPEREAMRLQSSVQALVTGWSAFAHSPYAHTLGSPRFFAARVKQDLDALLAGSRLSGNS